MSPGLFAEVGLAEGLGVELFRAWLIDGPATGKDAGVKAGAEADLDAVVTSAFGTKCIILRPGLGGSFLDTMRRTVDVLFDGLAADPVGGGLDWVEVLALGFDDERVSGSYPCTV